MSYLLGVVLFAVGIALTIGLHELGHMQVARWCGMRVRRFFIGFGPTVFQVTKGHTVYGLKAVPLGGFCDIAGMTALDEVTPEERPYAMVDRPWWQRIAVLLGGVTMNILVTLIVLYGVAVSSGLPNLHADYTPEIGQTGCVKVDPNQQCSGDGPAAAAGIKPGDRILAVDGQPVASFMQLREELAKRPGQTVTLQVERGSERSDVRVDVTSVTRTTAEGKEVTVGMIGVGAAPIKDAIKKYDPVSAIPATGEFFGNMVQATWQGLASFPAKIPGVVASIFGHTRDEESPMSVVGASRIGGEMAERSQWAMFMMMLASLNLFLALFNLIPLPPLDGGHIAVVVWEKIRDFFRKRRGLPPAGPADYEKLMPLTYAMSALLLSVGVLVIIADVVNPIRLF
ncbi:M50 family metallopeptidase [Corynebacterium epidermidicanis]|uniref:Zinc metalloprotease Rip1 n=1 Tax=Corynebacterium epidermidicanis TaxID=1050174 RepID=A0A0G3GV43_9CORY|nr:M50 family metallopeptidase [Corynebacterium epidermidicanis]AKK03403.1 putative membrane-associated Zn-dependent protease [Corynebacterium epidermidicanis]